MAIYLGLGSNLGDRHANLRAALAALSQHGIVVRRVSPIVESPAWLLPDAPPEWNAPFLNLVVECATTATPAGILDHLKQIETELGREGSRRWAPRPIDIDILLIDDLQLQSEVLTIPHPGVGLRPFVLTPLVALNPGLRIPGHGMTALQLLSRCPQRIPLWMGIINLTPDSFSDGGANASWPDVDRRIDAMIEDGVHFLDFGAESTRPRAQALSPDQEWGRLEPTLNRVIEKIAADPLRPRISIDTYHPEVAARAIALGVDVINDVAGLTEPAMIELAAGADAEFVAMHNLGLPADPGTTLETSRSAVDQVEQWLEAQISRWLAAGIDLNRILFDPGIGFGKNSLQSLELLRNVDRFANKGLRLLVGHSRKSFLSGFAGRSMPDRDLATLGASLALCDRGVDVLRIHDVRMHANAYRGWIHLQPQP